MNPKAQIEAMRVAAVAYRRLALSLVEAADGMESVHGLKVQIEAMRAAAVGYRRLALSLEEAAEGMESVHGLKVVAAPEAGQLFQKEHGDPQ